jgi:hypothetical protein
VSLQHPQFEGIVLAMYMTRSTKKQYNSKPNWRDSDMHGVHAFLDNSIKNIDFGRCKETCRLSSEVTGWADPHA